MLNESRTANSIRNVKIAIIFYFFSLILQFFSRKFFLDYLGSEVLGLNTTAQNLLGFLNLAELGIGNAVAYNLYKPLYNKDYNAINAIVSIQGWLYRRIAYIVLIGACILMFFFPIVFSKAKVPMWYAYGAFIVLLIGSLLGYFFNYKQIVLSADQKQYKITLSVEGVKLIKVFCQILAIRFLNNQYLWWLGIEVLMALITTCVLNLTIKQEYPWLKPRIVDGGKIKYLYPEVIVKTKQIFFHKIGSFALSQTSSLIIYAYTSLTLVAIYGNYMLIISGVTLLSNSLLNGISAGVGNLVAEGNRQHIKSIFWEITVLRMWIASIICFGIYMLGDSFITLWVGENYIMSHSAFMILIMICFINLTRTNDTFLSAYGLFQDIWSPIIEVILNLGLSILLGYYYSITGILAGVLISLLLVICTWKPYFLYKYGFKESILEYIILYFKYIIGLLASIVISYFIIKTFIPISEDNFLHLFFYALQIIVLYSIISFGILLCIGKSAKLLVRRITKIL